MGSLAGLPATGILHPRSETFISSLGLCGVRTTVVRRLSHARSYVVIKGYTSRVLESGPGILDIFISTCCSSYVSGVHSEVCISRRHTGSVGGHASGCHATCCGCCAENRG